MQCDWQYVCTTQKHLSLCMCTCKDFVDYLYRAVRVRYRSGGLSYIQMDTAATVLHCMKLQDNRDAERDHSLEDIQLRVSQREVNPGQFYGVKPRNEMTLWSVTAGGSKNVSCSKLLTNTKCRH
jgi:hypothetical protein